MSNSTFNTRIKITFLFLVVHLSNGNSLNSTFDISCYTPQCLSIGNTSIGIIDLNYTNNPITCNCTVLGNMTNSIQPEIIKPIVKPDIKQKQFALIIIGLFVLVIMIL